MGVTSHPSHPLDPPLISSSAKEPKHETCASFHILLEILLYVTF